MASQQEMDRLVAEAQHEIGKRDAEIERLRAALLGVPVYIDNTPWRTEHKDLLRSIGAWMGAKVDPNGLILEADLARKQKPTDQ